jgi:DNA-binding MarR family transcriptional regulator
VEDLAGAVLTVASLARGLERVLPDMTLAQYRILTMIGSSPQRAGRLAARAALSKSALTGLLDGLVGRGWVRRIEIEGDRRGVGLELTDGGAAARQVAEQALVERLERYLGFVEECDRTQALAGLVVLRRAVDAAWQAKQ